MNKGKKTVLEIYIIGLIAVIVSILYRFNVHIYDSFTLHVFILLSIAIAAILFNNRIDSNNTYLVKHYSVLSILIALSINIIYPSVFLVLISVGHLFIVNTWIYIKKYLVEKQIGKDKISVYKDKVKIVFMLYIIPNILVNRLHNAKLRSVLLFFMCLVISFILYYNYKKELYISE